MQHDASGAPPVLRKAPASSTPPCNPVRRWGGRLRPVARWLGRKKLEGRLWCHDSELEPAELGAMRRQYLAEGGSAAVWSKLTRRRISQIY